MLDSWTPSRVRLLTGTQNHPSGKTQWSKHIQSPRSGAMRHGMGVGRRPCYPRYCCTMDVCEKSGHWECSLQLLQTLKDCQSAARSEWQIGAKGV